MQGNTTQGYTVHVLCLRGPSFSYRVNMHYTCKIPCNVRGVAFYMHMEFYMREVVFHTRVYFKHMEHGIVHAYYFGIDNSRYICPFQ